MAQKEYIKDLWENEGLSLREISRRTGCCFKTVQKYARQEDWSPEKLPNLEPGNYPSLGKYIPAIDQWLETDRKAPRKQRHTAKRIYERLRDEFGFTGSYTSVRRYVCKKKRMLHLTTEGYLPLAQPKGWGQVDFGENFYYDANGQMHKGYELVVSFPHSNMAYTQFFPAQNQECLLTGLQRIFEHMGGVPQHLKFDNLSAAVVHVGKGGERELTVGFTRFKLHYRFQADFCNPASGNEKGNVENKVGYTRRNAFVPVPTISSLDAFNEGLWDWCEQDARRLHYRHNVPIQELWQEEQKELLPLPEHPYLVFRYEVLAVNKCGFVSIDTNRYGLAPVLAGTLVQAKLFFDHVEFYSEQQLVGSYRRSYGHNEELLDWTQYVGTLCKKPGATEHTRFFMQMPEVWQTLLAQSKGAQRRSALQLLSDIVRDGNAALCEDAFVLAAENGRTDVNSIRQCYYLISKQEFHPQPLELDMDVPRLNHTPDLLAYDGLTGGVPHA